MAVWIPQGAMDPVEQEKRQAMAEFRRSESSRRALLAIAVSIFFFFIVVLAAAAAAASSSSWLAGLLGHADLHLALLLINFPAEYCFWVDRKTMFFLCNVILVVIARDSGLLASFMPGRENCDELPVRSDGHRLPEDGLSKGNSVASAGSALHVLAVDNRSQPEEEEEKDGEEEEKEGEEEEEEGCPDMDELNKKFDDFIEKVKRDRKQEALQMVLALKRR